MITQIDPDSVHRITSGQVVVDLQSAVKELLENSFDAGATAIDVRFQLHGLKSIEVVDNGSGIAPHDHDSIALKHCTSKLSSFQDLSRIRTFGFRGEALSSLCALADALTVTTATASEAPMGTVIEMDRAGRVRSKCKVARQRGTTVAVADLFKPLPVRRKELERNAKREFQKALNLLHAYALVPCALENKGVRLTVTNQTEGGRKVLQFKTDGSPSLRASVSALWGSKALDNLVDLDLSFDVEIDKSLRRRVDPENDIAIVTPVRVQGLISKFTVGAGRTTPDRQFFFVNGRPYNPGKVQKAVNEIYRTFNVNQSPFVVANIIVPTDACDVNVSPDKRTIFLHSEHNLVQALKIALETAFSAARSTYDVTAQPSPPQAQALQQTKSQGKLPTQTRERECDIPESRTSTPPVPVELPCPHQHDDGDRPSVSFGAPHGLLGDRDDADEVGAQSEREPEPTLVAQPGPSLKGDMQDRTNDRRAPSKPLFVPDSDEEANDAPGRVDKGKEKECADARRVDAHAGALQTVRCASTTTGATTSTNVPDKQGSVQVVLNTRGAAWNLGPRRDGDAETARERKRARMSNEADRVRGKKSFRSSLSQFVSRGSKPLPGSEEIESEGSDEVDELDEQDDVETRANKMRPRTVRRSSQVTVVVPSDDEGAMDVDVPPSTGVKPSRVGASSTPQTCTEDDAGQARNADMPSEDDWAFSSTLVGTYVPPSGKPIEPPSNPKDEHAVTLRVNLIDIGTHYLDMYNRLVPHAKLPPPSTPSPSTTLRSAVSSANLETAAENTIASAALSRIISKADFEQMTVVGQFNLGFIVVRKRNAHAHGDGEMDDLFIVDQHAADEKWNFETLQETTVIASQKLFRPVALDLTAADVMVAIENMDVLKRNGFELERSEVRTSLRDDGNGNGDNSESVRVQLCLVAQPMSKDTMFDTKDLEELIHLMQDRPKGTMVRCSKARAMFAMRACRRSVMIGKALDKARMTAIMRHMGTMDQPWNCPHGRPTMRHLSDLKTFGRYVPPGRAMDWEGLASLI